MRFSDSIFASRFQITRQDLEKYLAEALSQGGDYADLYFEYLLTSSIGLDESMVKSASQGVSMGVGIRVISGERTGYAYSDNLTPERSKKAAKVAACIASGPSKTDQFDLREGPGHNLYPVLVAPTETAFVERVELVKRADRAARAYDPRIFQVQAAYADNLRQVMVATSEGVLTLDRQPMSRLSVSALARENGGMPQRGHAGGGGRVELDYFLKEKTPEHFAAEAAREAIAMLASVEAPAGEMTVVVNGGLRYKAKTDGRRNDLYERIFITTSPTYEETLPTIANPPSLRQKEGQQVIWTVTAPESFQKDHERCREIRSYGMDKIMQHSHEVTWRDEADSFTMRLHAAPQKGGDATLQWYVGAQNDLGWLQGVYTNYTDFCPTNTNWSPDHVQRRPDGEWRRAWPRNYALKPAKSVEMDDYYAQRIHEKYGTKMSYTDVHTANPPWEYCDYDARVPGAGTMAATFYAYGQLLLNDQRVYGPTQSEGTYQWLYAGLESGSYGWAYTKWNLLTEPVDVAFQLTKIHLLDCTYGMGDTNYYLEQIDPNWSKSAKRREYLDLSLATTIAYGNMGWLATEFEDRPFHWEAMARSYYMMQQLQQQYAFVQPARIEYADAGGAMLTASQAHSTGAIAASRLHVEYENGTHVYVNRGAHGDWTVPDAGGQKVELPPSGWLAYNQKNDFHEISAKVAGRRIDYVNAREFEFLDGRGEWTAMGRLAAAGSVARRQQPGGEVEFIDIYGNSPIGFQESRSGALAAFSGDGRALGQVELRSPRAGWYEFTPLDQGRTYVFSPGK